MVDHYAASHAISRRRSSFLMQNSAQSCSFLTLCQTSSQTHNSILSRPITISFVLSLLESAAHHACIPCSSPHPSPLYLISMHHTSPHNLSQLSSLCNGDSHRCRAPYSVPCPSHLCPHVELAAQSPKKHPRPAALLYLILKYYRCRVMQCQRCRTIESMKHEIARVRHTRPYPPGIQYKEGRR